jgi:hypothetical protein
MPVPINAGFVFDRACALLNDTNKTNFSDNVLIPYAQIAMDDLKEELEDNDIPVTHQVTPIIPIVIGITDIGGLTGPALPLNLIEIFEVYERTTGSTEDFTLIQRSDFLTEINPASITSVMGTWAWQQQAIQFPGATTNRDIKIHYIGDNLPQIVDRSTNIGVFNAKSFLAYRTAALAAEFVGENPTRATSLNNNAVRAMDNLINLSTKQKQGIATRRRPFMSRYKVTGSY